MNESTTMLRDETYISGLEDFCRKLLHPEAVLVELGSFGGESTSILARFAGQVYAVDPWEDTYQEAILHGCADQNIVNYLKKVPVPSMAEIETLFDERTRNLYNVTKIKDKAENVLGNFADRSIDVLYIDAIHTYEAVKKQIQDWRIKIKHGGLLAGHDFDRRTWPGVVRAVEEAIGKPDYTFSDTSWAYRIKD